MVAKYRIAALVGLLLLAGFLRLYQIDRYMQFQGDEGRDALVLWRMIEEGKLTLIGPGTSVGNMYNGPLYYYLVLPSFLLAGLSPVGSSVFVALVGVATVWLVYKAGKEWFSPLVGATAAALYAISPTVIIYSRSSWNPNVMPFFALLCIYSVWKVYKGGDLRWLIVSFGSLAFAIQSHYLGLLLGPTLILWSVLGWVRSGRVRRADFGRFAVYAGLIFSLLMSPILLFDIRHKFVNLRAMWLFFSQRQATVNFKLYKALPNMVPIFNRIVTTLIVGGIEGFGKVASVALGLGGLVLLIGGEKKERVWLLVSWIGFGLLGLGLYKQSLYDHYFGFLFPAVFILLGVAFEELWRRNRLGKIVITLLFLFLAFTDIERTPILAVPYDLYGHTVTVGRTIMKMSGGKSFNLGMIAKQNYDAGYRFVLTRLGAPLKEVPPDMTGQLFVVCELPPSECKPVGNPQAEIANFGWVKIEESLTFPWGVTLFRLVHYKP